MDRLDLTSVSVRSFYGHALPGLAALDLGPGVNVVYGPNGQGKTTLARAIHGVLWPETVEAMRPSYSAGFRLGGDAWRVEFDAGQARYQRGAAPADRMPLPDKSYRDRYELSLGDLLAADGGGFADIVRRDAAGGVDLDAARTALGFKAAPTQRLKVTAEAEEAARAVQRRQHALDALRVREQTLGEIATLAADAADAAELAELYGLLEEAAARADAVRAAERVAREFPAALAATSADTQERYDGHAEAVRTAATHRADVEDARASAQAALAAHGWDAVEVPDEAELRARATGVDAATRALDDAARTRAAAETREQTAREALGGSADVAATVDVAALGDVARVAQTAGTFRGREAALEGRRLAAKARLNDIRYHDADELARGAALLRQWLAHTAEGERAGPALPPAWVWAGAAALAVAGVALGLTVAPGAFWLTGGALALAVVAGLLGRAPDPAGDPAEAARLGFSATPLATLAEWTVPAVEQALDALERQAADQKERTMWKEAVAEIERALLNLESARAETDAEAARIGHALGVDVPDTPEALHLLTHNVLAWQASARDLAAAVAAQDHARAALAAATDRFNGALAGLPVGPVSDAAGAQGAVAQVAREAGERDRLRADLARLDVQSGQAAERLRQAETARDAFLARLGLQEPAAEAVQSLVQAFPAYTAAVADLAHKRTLADEARARASAHPQHSPEAVGLDAAALAHGKKMAEDRAARRDEWLEQKAQIQARVHDARHESALGTAHAEHARALDALERAYHEQADALVGHALADHVAEATRDQHLPQVFQRAREVLADITDDRFRLEFDAGSGAFRAFDAVRGRAFGLDELSSGTRLQLLLAVRLAFAEGQELGVRLPILLDEALANSDDERAGAIVEAVLRLCRQGRQVFYFTAQAEEVAKWRRLSDEHADVDCRFVGLPTGGALAAADPDAVPSAETTRPVPSADGLTLSDYADAAAVPAWTGWDAVEALHVWYLLDAPEEVRACLQRGYATWGQLRAAAERQKPVPVDLDAVALRARAVAAWRAAWLQGRGKPVDRATLEASGAVSDAFIDEVWALCGDCDRDGEALVECLGRGDVARYQGRQADKLEEFLAQEGYVSPDPRLPEAEVRRRVAEAVPHPDALGEALAVLDRIRQRSEAVAA